VRVVSISAFQTTVPEIGGDLPGESFDGEIPDVPVAFVLSHVVRYVGHRVECRVEGVYPLELQKRSVRKAACVVELTAFEERAENVERGWPGCGADRGAGFGQGLGNREPEAVVVRDARHQRSAPAEVDWKHG
jgi:hypothetical protein